MSLYHDVLPIDRISAERAIRSGDWPAICNALVSAAFHDPDGAWVCEQCLALLGHADVEVRRTAALCLGHVARIHGALDCERAVPALQALADDPQIGGTVGDALGDIRMFIGR